MHTTFSKSCVFIHNGDYSGETIIRNLSKNTNEILGEVTVNTQDLFDFVANYIRSQKINELENMSSDEILGLE